MISRSSILMALLLISAIGAKAQVKESAPQEPPFVQEDSEFDESLRIEDEIMSAEPNQPVPPPPSEKKSVDLNENVPEAGSVEDEMNQIGSDVVEEAPPIEDEPVVAAPVYTAPVVVRKNPKGGTEYIHHPQAAKGLMRIEKDGTYVYRTEEDKKFSQTGSFRVGMMDAPRITASDGVTTFKTMYTKGPVPVISFDFEWKPFDWMGNLAVQTGFGIIVAQGRGRFVDPSQTLIPKEEYTFAAVPLNLGALYRMQWKDRQAIAPFVNAGGTYFPVVEFRDDGEGPNAVGTPGGYAGAGLMFNVGSLDRETSFSLTTEYGIKNLWVVLEYRQIVTVSEDLDFTGGLANLGITTDF
ncbi:hypothetical protein [Bdellovibrio sp. HCB2-146]|uniref:hypothetical protein n=1 Tax=Bdellovibrio sp. HCB2-146 TaxID=3394362 RepID=UPI0039BCFE11